MQLFNIQMASQLSGVAAATIRAWEKRYHAVTPQRADNKHRLYSEQDIEKLALLNKLTMEGQSIGNIANLNLEELIKIYTEILGLDYQRKNVVHKPQTKTDSTPILQNLLIALSHYKLDIFSHELNKAQSVLTPRDYCMEILYPLLEKIKEMMLKNQIDAEREKTLSAIFQFYLLQMMGKQHNELEHPDQLVLITTPSGEWHELDIMGTALLCIHYGLRFIYLSNNTSARSLADMANSLKPRALIIGSTRKNMYAKDTILSSYLNELQHHLKHSVDIWWGGNALPKISDSAFVKNLTLFDNLDQFDKFLNEHFGT